LTLYYCYIFLFLYITKASPRLTLYHLKGKKGVRRLIALKTMVESLQYLVHTRPDLAYVVGYVNRLLERLTEEHLQAVKKILCLLHHWDARIRSALWVADGECRAGGLL
jgi:hypothetical protein